MQKLKRDLDLNSAAASSEPRIAQLEMTVKALEAQLLEKVVKWVMAGLGGCMLA